VKEFGLMERLTLPIPGADLGRWFAPLGLSVKIAIGTFSLQSILNFSWKDYKQACVWMGLRSFHLVALAAVFVAATLTIQLILELEKFRTQDIAAALISIGLLREIGPLTISLAWCARISAFIATETLDYKIKNNGRDFSQTFILPRYLAAVTMALPLATYGLLIGFATGAFISPLLGGCSFWDFLQSGMQATHNKDLVTYFLKLVLINPTIAIFAGSVCGLQKNHVFPAAASAVTATFICGYVANLLVTIVLFLRG
jgi:phospholipid/cholesterol/gamma-HCH transport system permease protein